MEDCLRGVSLRFVEDFRLYSEKPFDKAITAVEEVGKYIFDRDKEYMALVALDSACRPKCVSVVGIGTTTKCDCAPREILRVLALSGACAFILMHNHPSGTRASLRPSREDNELTDRYVQLSRLTGITLVDHIIVTNVDGKPEFFSYREKQKRRLNSFGKVIQDFFGEFRINKEDFPDMPPVLEGWERTSTFLTAYTEEELKKILENDEVKRIRL